MIGRFGIIGLIVVVIGILILFKKNYKLMFIYLFSASILTTTTFLNVGENAITVPHVTALLFFIMICIGIWKKTIKIYFSDKVIYVYAIFALFSILMSFIIRTDVNGYNMNLSAMAIQLVYLIMCITILFGTTNLIYNKYIDFTTFNLALKFITIEISILAIIQIINNQIFNKIFVNRLDQAIIQTLPSGKLRLTTTFNEPSMLAIFISLAMIYFVYTGLNEKHPKNIYYSIPYIIIGFLSRGSTFILSVSLCLLLSIFILYKKLNIRKFVFILSTVIVCLITINFLLNNMLFQEILYLLNKLAGKGTSGSERLNSFFSAIRLFFEYPLFGIGYGRVRTTDWLSTILINTGVVGIGLLGYFFWKKIFINSADNINIRGIKISILITLILLLVSVPEPYFNFIWIFLSFTFLPTSITGINEKIINEEIGIEDKIMLDKQPSVYIILVNFNGIKDTIDCINSLLKIKYKNYNIVIIDNNSSDKSREILLSYQNDKISVICLENNLGFAGGNNIGIEYALKNNADYILLLNNDTEVEPDFLDYLVQTAENNHNVGIVGGKINYFSEKNKIWFLGGKINTFLGKTHHIGLDEIDMGQYQDVIESQYVTGCLMLVNVSAIKDVGLMDEKYFLYYEETDWCAKFHKKGYKILVNPSSKIYHKVSSSTKKINDIVSYYYDRNSYYFVMNNYGILSKSFMYFYKRLYLIGKYIYFKIIKKNNNKCNYIRRVFNDINSKKMGKYHE